MTKQQKKKLRYFYIPFRCSKEVYYMKLWEKQVLDEEIADHKNKLSEDPSVENAIKLLNLDKRSNMINAIVKNNPIFLEPIIAPKDIWENKGRLPIDIKIENHTQRRIKLALTWEYLPENFTDRGDDSVIVQRQIEEEVEAEERKMMGLAGRVWSFLKSKLQNKNGVENRP